MVRQCRLVAAFPGGLQMETGTATSAKQSRPIVQSSSIRQLRALPKHIGLASGRHVNALTNLLIPSRARGAPPHGAAAAA